MDEVGKMTDSFRVDATAYSNGLELAAKAMRKHGLAMALEQHKAKCNWPTYQDRTLTTIHPSYERIWHGCRST